MNDNTLTYILQATLWISEGVQEKQLLEYGFSLEVIQTAKNLYDYLKLQDLEATK